MQLFVKFRLVFCQNSGNEATTHQLNLDQSERVLEWATDIALQSDNGILGEKPQFDLRTPIVLSNILKRSLIHV